MNEIAKAVKEALSLWKEYLSGRQAAYERKKDKKLHRALEAGESFIRTYRSSDIEDSEKEKRLDRYEKEFFKNNN